jgi:hypothetical protein
LVIPFDVEDTGSSLLDRIMRRLSTTIDSLTNAVTNDHLVSVTFLSASTDVIVRHGLDGPPVSWDVVDRDANANVWRSPTVNIRPREVIILRASAAAIVLVRFA